MGTPKEPALEPVNVSVREAARLLGLGYTKARELVMTNRLTSLKVDRRRLVPLAAIRSFTGGEEAA